jgi:hypothetical protein
MRFKTASASRNALLLSTMIFLVFCYEVCCLRIENRSRSDFVIFSFARAAASSAKAVAGLTATTLIRKYWLLKPFGRERDWSLSHRAPGGLLPVMPSSLRLANECGETNTNVFDIIHRRADK